MNDFDCDFEDDYDDFGHVHDLDDDGVCILCGEVVQQAIQADSEFSGRRNSRSTQPNDTMMRIKLMLESVDIDVGIKQEAARTLRDNNIQIRTLDTTKQVVFSHVYAAMYSRLGLTDEELFYITPDTLLNKFNMKKNQSSSSIRYIASNRIVGPGVIIIQPYLYLIEFRRCNPDEKITTLITDERIAFLKKRIHPILSPLVSESPCKVAIAYMHLLSDMNFAGEKNPKPIIAMYTFYKLNISMVKELLSTVRKEFFSDVLVTRTRRK